MCDGFPYERLVIWSYDDGVSVDDQTVRFEVQRNSLPGFLAHQCDGGTPLYYGIPLNKNSHDLWLIVIVHGAADKLNKTMNIIRIVIHLMCHK